MTELFPGTYRFRALLRFDRLHDYLGSAPTINLATLNFTLLNYDGKTHTLKARPKEAPHSAPRTVLSRYTLGDTGVSAAAGGPTPTPTPFSPTHHNRKRRPQVCALKKPWVATTPSQQYMGLGWSQTGARDAANA